MATRATSRRTSASPAKVAKARTRRASANTIDDLDAKLAHLREGLRVLEQAADALERMPRAEIDALPIESREQRARAIGEALLAMHRLRNAEIRTLNDAFDTQATKLAAATRRLSETLLSLREGADFVAAAAAAVSIVANLVVAIG